MEILETVSMPREEVLVWAEKAENCDWDAGRFLGFLMRNGMVERKFGEGSQALLLTDNGELLAFCTLAMQDEIDDISLTPWIGFVYTFPEFRGHRYSQKLIEYAVEKAKEQGFKKIYISSEEKGLYEKYGFKFVRDEMSIHEYITQIFERDI